MKSNTTNTIMMILLNAVVIGTAVFGQDKGSAIDLSSKNGIVMIVLLALMAVVDVIFIVKKVKEAKQDK